MRNINLALQEHTQKVLNELNIAESQLLGVFLYGSQNYGLATENSDVDTIAIVLPTEYDLYFSKPITKELHLENGEHCVVKDIREIFNEFKKQNVNFLEILVTPYRWINHRYSEKWAMFVYAWTETIVHYDMDRGVKSICGQGKHTLHQALREEKVDGKKMANALKMLFYLDKYSLGTYPFDVCILPTCVESEEIMNLKTGKVEPSREEAEALIKTFEEKEKSFEAPTAVPKDFVDKSLKRIAFEFCKISATLNPY